ncbi:MAG: hypothetical protein ACRC2S_00415 [Waterburya sp.]
MTSTLLNNTFCPDTIFCKLNQYITQVLLLDNNQVSNLKKILSRTLGTITISEKSKQKEIEIVKDNLVLYQATKADDWLIVENNLVDAQIQAISNLPQTKEEIFIEFYARQLTEKLKSIFQPKQYPIAQPISVNNTEIPFNFCLSPESTTNKLVFVGTQNNNIIFKSSFSSNNQVELLENQLSLEHLNRLSSIEA